MKLVRTPRGFVMLWFAWSGLYLIYNREAVGVGMKEATAVSAAAAEARARALSRNSQPRGRPSKRLPSPTKRGFACFLHLPPAHAMEKAPVGLRSRLRLSQTSTDNAALRSRTTVRPTVSQQRRQHQQINHRSATSNCRRSTVYCF